MGGRNIDPDTKNRIVNTTNIILVLFHKICRKKYCILLKFKQKNVPWAITSEIH